MALRGSSTRTQVRAESKRRLKSRRNSFIEQRIEGERKDDARRWYVGRSLFHLSCVVRGDCGREINDTGVLAGLITGARQIGVQTPSPPLTNRARPNNRQRSHTARPCERRWKYNRVCRHVRDDGLCRRFRYYLIKASHPDGRQRIDRQMLLHEFQK